jgi:prevent-host-death family protein
VIEVSAKEARDKLGRLLDRVERGDEIIITRRGKRVAVLTSAAECKTLPSLKKFRASISVKGKTLSETIVEQRQKERY